MRCRRGDKSLKTCFTRCPAEPDAGASVAVASAGGAAGSAPRDPARDVTPGGTRASKNVARTAPAARPTGRNNPVARRAGSQNSRRRPLGAGPRTAGSGPPTDSAGPGPVVGDSGRDSGVAARVAVAGRCCWPDSVDWLAIAANAALPADRRGYSNGPGDASAGSVVDSL